MKKLVIGMGVTGTEVARYLLAKGIPFDSYDDKKTSFTLPGQTDASRHFHDPQAPTMADYDELIVSPGLRQDHPVYLRAREAGLPLVAEVEYAFRFAKGPIVAITGSNGKSTTTSLIHHLIAGTGRKASLCGNIGQPMIACVDDDPSHIYVLELSSFQLQNTHHFRPNVALLLNVSADHLDWHGGFEGYEAAKLRIFANQTAEDLAVVCPEYLDRVPGSARKRAVPGPGVADTAEALVVEPSFRLSSDRIPLLGRHNRSNVLFACVAVQDLGIGDSEVAAVLPSFKALEHRMEPVGTFQGRLWINDSKATNGHACQAAIDALAQPFVLVMGGCDKGERFTSLDFSKNPPKAIVAYGETAPILMEDLKDQPIRQVHLFKDAVLEAHALAGEGAAVLMAPACASFDQFDNYMHRGKVFREIFKTFSGSHP